MKKVIARTGGSGRAGTSWISVQNGMQIQEVDRITNGTPEHAFYGLAVYYILCLLLNWWYYDRKNAEVKC